MKRISIIQSFFAVFCALFILVSFSSNPPQGRTGAPLAGGGNEAFCAGCHGGNTSNYDGTIDVTGVPSTIMPNTTYPVAVTITRTQGTPTQAGFSMTILDGSNTGVGLMSNPGSNTAIAAGTGREYAEHAGSKQYGSNNAVTYNFDWTSPASISGSNITFYAVTVLGSGGASTNQDYSFTHYPTFNFGTATVPLAISNISTSDPLCFNAATGSASVTASGGTGSYTYAWSSGGSGQMETGLTPGNYSVTVSSGTESLSQSFTIGNAPQLNIAVTNQTNITCNDATGTATASANGGTGSLSILWDNGETGTNAVNLSAGSHTVSVTDANQCQQVTTVFINSDTNAPVAEAGSGASLDCNNTQAQLSGSGSSQGAIYSYQWVTPNGNIVSGANTLNPLVDAAGTYTLTVTNNSNGCNSSDFVFVTNNVTPPIAEAGNSVTLDCNNTSVILDGSASSTGNNISYAWSDSNSNVVSNGITATVNTAGTYTLTVINNINGCTSSDQVTVTQDDNAPTASSAANVTIDCNTPFVTLDGTGSSTGSNITYEWFDPNSVSFSNAITATTNVPGNYTLAVTDTNNGCTSEFIVTVTSNIQVPNAEVAAPAALDCNSNALTLDGSGSATGSDISYSWSTSNGNILSGNTTASIQVNAIGEYCLTVTNGSNGCSNSTCVTVAQASDPAISISNQTDIACNGEATGSATVQASGGSGTYNFLWNTGITSNTVQNLPAGEYSVTVTDTNGCSDEISITLEQPDALALDITSTNETASAANDGTATADPSDGTAPYTYIWSNGATTQMISGLSPDNYSVTITDNNNCQITGQVSIGSFDCAITADIQTTNILCNGQSTGSAEVITNNATMPITYQWSSGGTAATEANLTAGTYTVTVNDAANCELILTASIIQPAELTGSVSVVSDVSCNGFNDGQATISTSGGTAPINILWPNNGDGTALAAGMYSATLTDNNQCQTEVPFMITEPTALSLDVTATEASAEDANDGTATANPEGGTAGYTFVWSSGETTSTISGLSPDNYCVTITDANGCTATACVDVTISGCASLAVQFSTTDISCNGLSDGAITAMPMGGSGSYSYLWSNGATTATIDNLNTDTYSVEITDTDACTITGQTFILEPAAIDILNIMVNNIECPELTNGSATITAAGGTGQLSYTWSNGGTGETQEDLPAGNYMVTATDENGCTTSASFEVATSPDMTPPVVLTQDIILEADDAGITISALDIDNGTSDNCGIGSLTLSQTEFDCSDLGDNIITLFATDINGNTNSNVATVTIIDTTAPSVECPQTFTVDCAGVVDYSFTAEDACGEVTAQYDPNTAPGSQFPIGTTLVEFQVVDLSGNLSSCSFEVTVDGILFAEIETVSTSCNGGNDGSITISPQGGAAPYTVTVTGGATDNLAAGTYEVTITDANNCTSTAEAIVNEPDAITIDLTEIINEQGTSANGAITIEVTGGTGSYEYAWTGPDNFVSSDEDLVDLVAGAYVLNVTDENGCVVTSEVFTVDNLSSLEEPTWANELTIFPNPTDDILSIETRVVLPFDTRISVLNVTGQELHNIQQELLGTRTQLDLRTLSSGLYWIKIQTDTEFVVRKIVVE